MKKILTLLTLAILPAALFVMPACAAAPSIPPARPATQAETDAGTVSNKFVSPLTLAGYSLAQSTGSISAATATNIAAYQALIATNNHTTTNLAGTILYSRVVGIPGLDSPGMSLGVVSGGGLGALSTGDSVAIDIGNASIAGNGQYWTNLHGTNIQSGTISNGAIANLTISMNKMDATAHAAYIAGGTTYGNDTGLPGVVNGSNIGTNLASLATSTNASINNSLTVQAGTSDALKLAVRAISGQTANVLEVQNIGNTALFAVGASGALSGNGSGITNIPLANLSNAGTAGYSNTAAFVLFPTNSGSDGQIVSLTGNKTKWITDATAAGALPEVATNALLYTTNVAARYDTNTVRISTGLQSNPDAWFDTIGSAGTVTPHFVFGGSTAYINFDLPMTNSSDWVHFGGSLVIGDAANLLFATGTLALPAATGVTPAENDNDTSVATTAYVQTEIAGFGSGQTNVTDTAAYSSQVNSNLTVKGDLTVQGTASVSTNNSTNMVFVGRANALMQIGAAGVLETNSVTTAPITGAGVAATFEQINNLAPNGGVFQIVTNGGGSFTNTGNISASTFTGSGANLTAVNAATATVVDGTDATSFVGIFDSATGSLAAKTDGALLYDASAGALTANAYFSPTNANNTGAYTAGLTYHTNLTGNITLTPFASIPSGSWSITIAATADGTTRSITFPNGTVNNAVNTAPAVAYVTNGTTLVLQVVGFGSTFTNVLTPH